jgi:hypothetical protein
VQPAYKTDKVEGVMAAWDGDGPFRNNRKTYHTRILGIVLGRVRCASHARVDVMRRHQTAPVGFVVEVSGLL